MKLLKIICFSIPVIIGGVFAFGVVSWIYGVTRPPEIGEGVKSVDWLPAEATDISYYRSYTFTAYEFRISEEGFRNWAATAAYAPGSDFVEYQPVTEVSELSDERFYGIERYNFFLKERLGQDENDPGKPYREITIKILNGLQGEMRRASAGGYSIGYDRNTGTAYWQSNPR